MLTDREIKHKKYISDVDLKDHFQYRRPLLGKARQCDPRMIGFIVTLLVARVVCETHSVHYERHVSRRSRSNAKPFETEYVYSEVNTNPNAFEVYRDDTVGVGAFNTIPVNRPSVHHTSRTALNHEYRSSHKDEGDELQLKPIEEYNKNLMQKLKLHPEYDQSSYISYDISEKSKELYPLKYINRDIGKHLLSDVSTEKFLNILDHSPLIKAPHKESKVVFSNHLHKEVEEKKIASIPVKENSVLVENDNKNSSVAYSYSDVINGQAQPINHVKIDKGDILLNNNFSSHDFTFPLNISNTYSHSLSSYKEPNEHSVAHTRQKAEAKLNVDYMPSKMDMSVHSHSPTNFHEPIEHSVEHARQKAEAKLNINYMPSKMHTDALYERLKALMHYSPPISDSISYSPYHSMNDYHIDDNDIRSGMTSFYDSSPYIFENAYDLEHSRADYEMQRSKDKRYAIDTERDHIPVHELMHEYEPEYLNAATTPVNPMHGNQPFFSYVLNDYYQKNDEDPINFKGINTWVDDLDYESKVDESLRRHQEPQNEPYFTTNAAPAYHKPHHNAYEKIIHSHHGDSAADNGFSKNHEYENQKKGNDIKSDHHSGYKHDGKKYKGLKDFLDTFENKFGKENVKKNSKYKLNHNQDKGEKKKGFRRVYHKDEYQEEDEFYDHNNKSANAVESGSLSAHNNAVEAYLKSHSAANLHDDANAYSNAGNLYKNDYEKNRSGYGRNKGSDSQFHKYRDEANKVVQRNNDFNPGIY